MKLTYDAILNDPRLLDRVLAQARHERALTVHRLIIAPLKGFFSHHAARPQREIRYIRGRVA
ncbi:MAG: hypothetical protein M3544_11790 [Pseudomonadota bacterium]|jgi:hypothetical protein|nr:hypothetical protein [Pseudomonadota bacterium]